jgi:hypothetical protein
VCDPRPLFSKVVADAAVPCAVSESHKSCEFCPGKYAMQGAGSRLPGLALSESTNLWGCAPPVLIVVPWPVAGDAAVADIP